MRYFILIFSLIIVFHSEVRSEEISLSLEDALNLAEENDPAIQNAKLEIELGDVKVTEAFSTSLPVLNFSSSLNHFVETQTSYIPSLGRVRFTPINDISNDLNLQQPLWLAGKIGMALDAAKTYRLMAREAAKTTRAKIKSEVTAEYFGFILADELVRVTKDGFKISSEHAEVVENMYNVGLASEFDLLRAKVEVASLEPELSRAEQSRTLAYLKLSDRLGIADSDTIILTEKLESSREIKIESNKEAYRNALVRRTEFNLLNYQERLDAINIRSENRSVYWPNLYFILNYKWQASDDEFSSFNQDSTWMKSLNWVVSLQIPLFDGFATSARVQRAQIGLRQTKLERRRLEQTVRLEVTRAISELKRTKQLIESAIAALDLAERVYNVAKLKYQEGAITELEVLDAQVTLHRAKLSLAQGYYDRRIAESEFARVVENDSDL